MSAMKRQSVGPALCERIALAQVEYRGDLRISLNLGGDVDDDNDDRHDRRRHWGVRHVGPWVVFADAGRGWMVGDARVGNYQYRDNEFPDLKTFRSDVGAGLDFDVLGFFIAKSTSDSGERPNFFVRVRHRF